jgi:hypothetical protein
VKSAPSCVHRSFPKTQRPGLAGISPGLFCAHSRNVSGSGTARLLHSRHMKAGTSSPSSWRHTRLFTAPTPPGICTALPRVCETPLQDGEVAAAGRRFAARRSDLDPWWRVAGLRLRAVRRCRVCASQTPGGASPSAQRTCMGADAGSACRIHGGEAPPRICETQMQASSCRRAKALAGCICAFAAFSCALTPDSLGRRAESGWMGHGGIRERASRAHRLDHHQSLEDAASIGFAERLEGQQMQGRALPRRSGDDKRAARRRGGRPAAQGAGPRESFPAVPRKQVPHRRTSPCRGPPPAEDAAQARELRQHALPPSQSASSGDPHGSTCPGDASYPTSPSRNFSAHELT